MATISIGVCVYNEEKNIRSLLNSLLNQKTTTRIKEIIVVSSACSDKTDDIIEKEFLPYNPEIVLLKQEKREGKASAINLFLAQASGDIVILESGDTIPAEDAIENLTQPFKDPKIGMTGGRPVPVNARNTFMGFTVHLLWDLHHKLATKHPKLGEMVAFRKDLIKKIPTDTAVDEAFVEALIMEQGFELSYAPKAIVYNKGPETISDFLKQRRRIFAGHVHLKKKKGYAPSSMGKLIVLKLTFENVKFTPKEITWTIGAIFLELYGRFLGLYDIYIKNANPFIWNMAESTKGNILITDYNPDVYQAAQRIKLWSTIRQQNSFQGLQTTSEASLLSDKSNPISVQPEISSKTDVSPQTYLTKESSIEHKTNLKIMIKWMLPIIVMEGISLINDMFDVLSVRFS